MTPHQILLRNFQSPGDIVCLTAAVRDLHLKHPGKFKTAVQTGSIELWQNNPHVDFVCHPKKELFSAIDCKYPAILSSNISDGHFVSAFHKFLSQVLGVEIPLTRFHGDLHLSESEKSKRPIEQKYWVMVAGGKMDFTTKWWGPESYQTVVDEMHGRVHFVQIGLAGHWHKRLSNVTDLLGKTDLRDVLQLIYHSEGVVCPVTFAMHAAAAIPLRPEAVQRIKSQMPPETPKDHPHWCPTVPLRPCVVIAGGREAPHWEAYPGHRFLHNVGSLPCCAHGGCWRSRATLVKDGSEKDGKHICLNPIQHPQHKELSIAKCMTMITPPMVCDAIDSYYTGGVLEY